MAGFSVILIPTDPQAPSREALHVAASLAGRGARVVVLPVGADPSEPPGLPTFRFSDATLRLEYASRPGPAAEAVLTLADDLGCDLIVIGRQRGESAVSTLGLVAQEVLRRATCPVVCLPSPEELAPSPHPSTGFGPLLVAD